MEADPQDGWKVLEKAVELSRAGEAFVLATVVWRQGPSSGKEGSRAIVRADGSTFGWIGGACAEPVLFREARTALTDGRSRLLLLGMDEPVGELPDGMVSVPISCQSEGALQVHVEPVLPLPTVIVVGKSPMAATLVELVDTIGWRGELRDPAEPGSIPDGSAVIVASQGNGDEEILLDVVRADPAFVGLVSSAKRGSVVLDYLRDHGVDDETITDISVPVGIDLGATSHREMAASILAELVAVRASGRIAGPVSAPPAPATAVDPVCGMTVDADDSSRPFEHEGTTYYFCCPGCRASFAKDPEAYLRRDHADHQ